MGLAVGFFEGLSVGLAVGFLVGLAVGFLVGLAVGLAVGLEPQELEHRSGTFDTGACELLNNARIFLINGTSERKVVP